MSGRNGNRAWVTGAAIVMVTACAGCSSAASQDPAPHAQIADRTATGEYLRAREALIRSSMADLPAGRRPMAAFVARIRAACPGALRGTPVNQIAPRPMGASVGQERAQFQDATFVVGVVEEGLEAAQQEPQAAAAQRFATTVSAIRWSNPRITDLVDTFIEIERERRDMPQRDVCREIREWATSGYRKVPVLRPAVPGGTIGRRWMLDMAALGCGKFSPAAPEEVLRALRPYRQPGGRPTTREVELMEIRLSSEEARTREGATRSLSQALGLSATRRQRPKRRRPSTALKAPLEPPGCRGTPDVIFEQVKQPVGGVVKVWRPAASKPLAETLPARKAPDKKKALSDNVSARKTESFRDRLVAKVVACLHKAGVNIPRSDSALLSSTSGIKTRDPRVRAAIGRCRSES
jgi:hypothetical protein